MAIGRPISLTPNIATKNISSLATADQTEFTVTGGYRINEIAVYRNGVRLAQGRDFTASDGTTVNLVSGATESDVIEFSVFDSFNVADAIVGAASSQTVNGDLNVTGNFYSGSFNPTSLVGTAATFNSTIHVGSAFTANAAGDVETIGIITANKYYGDGSTLSNITSTTINSNADNRLITGSGTANTLNGESNLTFDGSTLAVTGAITASGAVNVDATTDSTSSTSGALIVDGGVGIAKNVYIGAGLSVAGTLTYEDVTNVDSVGLITAKSGVNVSGGQLVVGTAYSVGNAGVVTAQNVTISAGTIDLKNSGSVSNIKFYCESANAHYTALQSAAHSAYSGNVTITLPTTTDTLVARTTTDTLTNKTLTSPTITGTGSLTGGAGDFSSNLTVGSGITFGSAGVSTFSGTADVHLLDNVRLNVGDGSDLAIYHNGTDSYIKGGTSGELVIRHDAITMQAVSSTDTYLDAVYDGAVSLRYNNSTKFATTNDGVSITGICSATDFSGLSAGAADFPNGINVANTKTVAFPGDGATGATIKHQSGHFEINNDTGNVYFDTAGAHYLRTGGSTVALTIDGSQNSTFAGTVSDSIGELRAIPENARGTAYTLVASDAGKCVTQTHSGGITIDNSVFSTGDAVTIINHSGSSFTITQGSGVTLYNTADASTGNKTLTARGTATVWFESASIGYISGNFG